MPTNWYQAVDDNRLELLYTEYQIYGLQGDKPCGRIDYIFRNTKTGYKYAVECKIGGSKEIWHNLSSLKVLGYKELYEYDRSYRDGKDEKIIPAVLITKDALNLNVVYVLNSLKVKCFVLYPNLKISTILLRNIPGYLINTIIHSDTPPQFFDKYSLRK